MGRPLGLVHQRFGPLTLILIVVAVLLGTLLVGGGIIAVRAKRDAGRRAALVEATRLLEGKRPAQALRVVSKFLDRDPRAGEAWTLAGRAFVSLDRLGDARRAFERGLVLRPDQPLAEKILAAIYLTFGDGRRGLAHLEAAARLDPRDPLPWSSMGKVHRDAGDPTASSRAFREALRRDPHLMVARLGLVADLLDLGQFDEAGGILTALDKDHPEDVRVLQLAAEHAWATGRLADASGLTARVLDLDPDLVEALLLRAKLAIRRGDDRGALVALERINVLNPNHLAALPLLAQVESRLGLAERSALTSVRHAELRQRQVRMDQLTKAIAQTPADPRPRWQLGRVALKAGMTQLARNCFAGALDADPSFRPARDDLARLVGPRPNPVAYPRAYGPGANLTSLGLPRF